MSNAKEIEQIITDPTSKTLYDYMSTLLDAGFDINFMLEKGYDAALLLATELLVKENSHPTSYTIATLAYHQRAAELVRDVTRAMGIDGSVATMFGGGPPTSWINQVQKP